MNEILAKIDHLNLAYGAVCAVRDVCFELYAGEILAVIGPNGSGKTSAIECLEGLRLPTGGKVELLGLDPYRNRRRVYRQVGIQLQSAEYPDKLRVHELCRLFSAFYDSPADWKQLLKQFGLEEKAKRMVKKLSGGEKQRLSILLALLPRPKLLILDELTTGLDPEVRRGMWESLKQIRQMGMTVLLVSHYLDEVAYLADRLVYMENGVSSFVGNQKEFERYVKAKVPAEDWKTGFTLEELYLLLSPKSKRMELEGIL